MPETPIFYFNRFSRLLLFLAALAVGLLAMKVSPLGEKIHPLFVAEAVGLGFIFFLVGFKRSLDNPIIPFLGLMMTLFLIFIEKKYFKILGLDLKLYMLMFGMASAITLYHLANNFGHLWKTYPLFRFIFIFFIINCAYIALGYFSDFRLSTDLMSMRYAKAQAMGGNNFSSQQSREFGAFAQYILHIDTLVPLVSTTVSLMLFNAPKSNMKDSTILHKVIMLISAGVGIHYILAIFAPLLKTSPGFNFIAGDVDPGTNFLLPMWLLMFMGFKYYLFSLKDQAGLKGLHWLVNFDLLYTLFLIASIPAEAGGSSSMAIALISGLAVMFVVLRYLKLDLPIANLEKLKKSKIVAFIIAVIMLAGILGVLYYLSYRLESASTNDVSSLNMRFSHWRDVMEVWYAHLDMVSFFFGYGLDKVMETVYYMSNSSAVEQGIQSPHNIYIAMIFNYGLMSIPFFGAIYATAFSGVKFLKDKMKPLAVKIFSGTSLSIVVGLSFMWLFLDMTIIIKILVFTMLGFLESLKHANLDDTQTA